MVVPSGITEIDDTFLGGRWGGLFIKLLNLKKIRRDQFLNLLAVECELFYKCMEGFSVGFFLWFAVQWTGGPIEVSSSWRAVR